MQIDRPLRRGDWVRCTSVAYPGRGITVGKLYRVLAVVRSPGLIDFVRIIDDLDRPGEWSVVRFEFVGELASMALEIEHGQTPTAG